MLLGLLLRDCFLLGLLLGDCFLLGLLLGDCFLLGRLLCDCLLLGRLLGDCLLLGRLLGDCLFLGDCLLLGRLLGDCLLLGGCLLLGRLLCDCLLLGRLLGDCFLLFFISELNPKDKNWFSRVSCVDVSMFLVISINISVSSFPNNLINCSLVNISSFPKLNFSDSVPRKLVYNLRLVSVANTVLRINVLEINSVQPPKADV